MKANELKALADRILDGKASPEDIARYNEWFNSFQEDDETTNIGDEAQKEAKIYSLIQKEIKSPDLASSKFLRLTGIAAAFVLFFGTGGYFLRHHVIQKGGATYSPNEVAKDIIRPGGNYATLTLPNGKSIALNQAGNGKIIDLSGSHVVKPQSGLLIYQKTNETENSSETLNLLTTPRGGQFRLVLSDGTKVWLNAASSIRFPTAFTGHERKVEITGEVYFEVIHDDQYPFKVLAGGQVIEDLGTHFNVNAYEDEPEVVTTLAEGKVSVSKDDKKLFLEPGQQAIGSPSNNSIKKRSAEVARVLAWKDGYFQYNHTDLHTVLREFSRWYDVVVAYNHGEASVPEFSGRIHRDVNLSEALEILKYAGIKCEVQGRKIIVTP